MDKNPIQVAGRLFGALEYLADHGAAQLTDIAQCLDLNKSTTHRVLASLQYMGYVKQDPVTGRYEPAFRLVDMANRIMEKMDIVSTCRPQLLKLMERCGETVHFVKMEGTDCIYIDKEEAEQQSVRMVSHIGRAIPFYRSAVGKALAARLSREEVKILWDACTIERMTAYTITDFEDFMEELDEVRRKGYALDNEENETGVRCIGVALDFGDDSQKYAISISVPITRMDNDRIRELSGYILRTKANIEAEFKRS